MKTIKSFPVNRREKFAVTSEPQGFAIWRVLSGVREIVGFIRNGSKAAPAK